MLDEKQDPVLAAARKIVPLLIKTFKPRSVVDIGCGSGAWLKVFEEHGVTDYLGIDINTPTYIPINRFIKHDLRSAELPKQARRKFDLALCLEVAEHLPEQYAETLINNLCQLSDTICFSAAIPFQGGCGHVNEKWPEYWAELFSRNRYKALDILRGIIWNDSEIPFWYRQNILIYIREEKANNFHLIHDLPKPLSIVHPQLYLNKIDIINNPKTLTVLLLAKRYLLRKLSRSRNTL